MARKKPAAADSPAVFDLLVVGGGPAGSATAIRARALGLGVLIIEREAAPRMRACAGWLGPAGVALAAACGCDAKQARPVEFGTLRLRSWDLKKSAEIKEKALHGWFVERDRFDAALLDRARSAGAEVVRGVWPTALSLGEADATARLSDGREVRGRVVVIADGGDSPTAALANLQPAARLRDAARCAHAAVAVDSRETSLEVVLGGGRELQLVTIVRTPQQIRLSFLTRDASRPAAAQLGPFLAAAQAAGVLPKHAELAPEMGVSPAGAALDMELHVGKRSLLVGDAGGFVAAFSNEGIYPAMKSGWLAAELAADALKAPVLQDELARFGALWRAELAEYLRMPNTDLSLLLPLVFNNAQMSQRVARAFLMGQKF